MKVLDQEEARALTDKIRAGLDELIPLIREAWAGDAHLALGYLTWEKYCRAEFRGMTFPGDLHPAIVQLHQDGMSGRAIGLALDIAESTARRHVRDYRNEVESAGAANDAPARITIKGADGKEYPIGPETCEPITLNARIKISPLHFGREAVKLVETIEAQDYGPDDLTADQVDVLMALRDALKRFGEVFITEERRIIASQ